MGLGKWVCAPLIEMTDDIEIPSESSIDFFISSEGSLYDCNKVNCDPTHL